MVSQLAPLSLYLFSCKMGLITPYPQGVVCVNHMVIQQKAIWKLYSVARVCVTDLVLKLLLRSTAIIIKNTLPLQLLSLAWDHYFNLSCAPPRKNFC